MKDVVYLMQSLAYRMWGLGFGQGFRSRWLVADEGLGCSWQLRTLCLFGKGISSNLNKNYPESAQGPRLTRP